MLHTEIILVNTNNCGQAHWHLRTDSIVHSFHGNVKVYIYFVEAAKSMGVSDSRPETACGSQPQNGLQRSMQQSSRGGQKYSRGRQAS